MDLISRQDAIEAIKEDKIDLTNPNVVAVFKATGDFEKVETQVMTCDRHIKILKDLPSERKHGKWVKARGSWCTPGGDPVWECSECGKGVHVYGVDKIISNIEWRSYGRDVADGQWVSCPNCGAMMEIDDESNQ